MNLIETEEYLISLISYERFGTRGKYGQKDFSLSVFRHLLNQLGNPQQRLSAIHVAGTDGKGSVCQYLTSVLTAHGYTVGTYTSPHLENIRERISVNNIPISGSDFASQFTEMRPLIDSIPAALPLHIPQAERQPVSYFEALTACAFKFFASQNLDFCIVETGLGGRLDSTNVLSPLACLLTPIDLEHTDLLGPDHQSIAQEKAGIAKLGNPFLIGYQVPSLSEFIFQLCLHKGAMPYDLGQLDNYSIAQRAPLSYDFSLTHRWTPSETPSRWELRPSETRSDIFSTPLVGDHQVRNAALSIYSLLLLEKLQIVFDLDMHKIQLGLANTRWPGRIEIFQHTTTHQIAIIDGSHTLQASTALKQTLDQLYPRERRHFILGFLHGKRITEIVQTITEVGDCITSVQPISERAFPSRSLYELIEKNHPTINNISHETSLDQALQDAIVSGEKLIVVTGSLYLAAEARKILKKRSFTPLHSPGFFE